MPYVQDERAADVRLLPAAGLHGDLTSMKLVCGRARDPYLRGPQLLLEFVVFSLQRSVTLKELLQLVLAISDEFAVRVQLFLPTSALPSELYYLARFWFNRS